MVIGVVFDKTTFEAKTIMPLYLRLQQTIRETLLNRKDQLLKAAYYEVSRNEAKVTNYFALNVTTEKDKK